MNQTNPQSTIPSHELSSLEGVSKTLLIPLFARAYAHTLLPACSFRDPVAADVVSSSSLEIPDVSKDRFPMRLCISRSERLQTQLLPLLDQRPTRQILLLACGLDTLPQRLSHLPNPWICADLAPVMDTRNQLLPTSPRIQHASISLPNQLDALQPMLDDSPPVIILEGILPYLSPDDVQSCFETLATLCPQGADILTDSYHPTLLAFAEMGNTFKRMKVGFQFGLAHPKQYETIHPKLQFQDSWNLLDSLPWYTKKRCWLPALFTGGAPLSTLCHLRLQPTRS